MSVIKVISLHDMPYEVMLIVEHASGVFYKNQVGGVACGQEELEGVLAPVELEPDTVERVMGFPYGVGGGIDTNIADLIDSVLAEAPSARYLRVDRSRLEESSEAWVFVLVASPDDIDPQHFGPYFGAPFGFGSTRGVLTWPNSD